MGAVAKPRSSSFFFHHKKPKRADIADNADDLQQDKPCQRQHLSGRKGNTQLSFELHCGIFRIFLLKLTTAEIAFFCLRYYITNVIVFSLILNQESIYYGN